MDFYNAFGTVCTGRVFGIAQDSAGLQFACVHSGFVRFVSLYDVICFDHPEAEFLRTADLPYAEFVEKFREVLEAQPDGDLS